MIGEAINVADRVLDLFTKSKAEKRREKLGEFDKALDESKKGSLKLLVKWFGKQL